MRYKLVNVSSLSHSGDIKDEVDWKFNLIYYTSEFRRKSLNLSSVAGGVESYPQLNVFKQRSAPRRNIDNMPM